MTFISIVFEEKRKKISIFNSRCTPVHEKGKTVVEKMCLRLYQSVSEPTKNPEKNLPNRSHWTVKAHKEAPRSRETVQRTHS